MISVYTVTPHTVFTDHSDNEYRYAVYAGEVCVYNACGHAEACVVIEKREERHPRLRMMGGYRWFLFRRRTCTIRGSMTP